MWSNPGEPRNARLICRFAVLTTLTLFLLSALLIYRLRVSMQMFLRRTSRDELSHSPTFQRLHVCSGLDARTAMEISRVDRATCHGRELCLIQGRIQYSTESFVRSAQYGDCTTAGTYPASPSRYFDPEVHVRTSTGPDGLT